MSDSSKKDDSPSLKNSMELLRVKDSDMQPATVRLLPRRIQQPVIVNISPRARWSSSSEGTMKRRTRNFPKVVMVKPSATRVQFRIPRLAPPPMGMVRRRRPLEAALPMNRWFHPGDDEQNKKSKKEWNEARRFLNRNFGVNIPGSDSSSSSSSISRPARFTRRFLRHLRPRRQLRQEPSPSRRRQSSPSLSPLSPAPSPSPSPSPSRRRHSSPSRRRHSSPSPSRRRHSSPSLSPLSPAPSPTPSPSPFYSYKSSSSSK